MMKKSVLAFGLICFSSAAITQIVGAGIQPKFQFSRQINIIQSLPKKFARTTYTMLSSPGIDVFVDYQLSDHWRTRAKVGYESKGFVVENYYIENNEKPYKFNYLALDVNLMRYWGNSVNVRPYNYIGVTTGYLLNKQATELSIPYSINGDPNFPSNYNGYERLNFGYTVGFGLSFNDVLWLELERNGDLISPYKSDVLHIRNVVSSVSVGINLLKIFVK